MNKIDVRDEFQVHMLNADGKEAAVTLAGLFTTLLDRLDTLCGSNSREMEIVRTKLQEASFFAKRAIAVQAQYQERTHDT